MRNLLFLFLALCACHPERGSSEDGACEGTDVITCLFQSREEAEATCGDPGYARCDSTGHYADVCGDDGHWEAMDTFYCGSGSCMVFEGIPVCM